MLFLIFLILPIIFIGFKFSTKIAYFGSLTATVFSIILALFLDIDLISVLITISVFNFIPLIGYYFNKLKQKEIRKIDRDKKLTLQTVNKLESGVEKLGKINQRLSNRTNEISKLYEVTKQMSKGLEFEQVFRIFTNIIKQNFTFQSCKFIVLINGKLPSKGYFLKKEKITASPSEIPVKDLEEMDKKIIHKLKELKSSFFITKDKKEPESFQPDFDLTDDSLTAIPLISEQEIIAVLIITGLPYKEYFNLLIFTGQFALQLRKVRLYEKIQKLAIKDDLTGVFVRRYFLQRSKEEFKRAVKHHFSLALLMLDLDYFKKHNDKYGHLVGDRLLKEVADIITSTVREIDLVGRYGGEEFAIALPDTDVSGAELVAERLRAGIQEHKFKVYDETVNVTASLGVCSYPKDTHYFSNLINYADMALYRAKNEGRNRWCTFNPSKDKIQYHKV